jgi:CRISPR-associated protein (TIGR03986 family)
VEKKEKIYKILKPNSECKADFMYLSTPDENPAVFSKEDIFRTVSGFLKKSGPNKVEKVNEKKSGKPVPKETGDIILGDPMLRNIFVANAKKRKNRDRLIPEFTCSDSDKNVTYTMNKRCERVFYKNENKKDENDNTLPISAAAIEKFSILVEEYKKNAEQQETPKVFRTILPEDGKLRDGDLFYFRDKKNEVLEIIPVRISRMVDDRHIGKRFSRDLRPCHGEWLEENDITALNNYPEKKLLLRHPQGLCPACRLFGNGAYKGRVRFGFAGLENEPKWLKENPSDPSRGEAVMLPLLERPRPTWSMPKPKEEENFDPKVPGRKFYLHHNGWEAVKEGKHPGRGDKIKKSPNNRSVEALDEGNTFSFEICFENLEEYELGLLLYTLQLEKNLAHKLGMAKSMGFGSAEIDIEQVCIREDAEKWRNADAEETEDRIQAGKQKLSEWFKADFDSIPYVADLKKLLYFPEKQKVKVCYPPLKKEKGSSMRDYDDLKKNKKEQERVQWLTTPWKEW